MQEGGNASDKTAGDGGRGRDIALAARLAGWVRYQILAGVYVAGQRLPTAPLLAARFGVDPNTARAAYRRLNAAGIVESARGRGTFVSDSAGVSTADGGDFATLLALIDQTAGEARRRGIAPDDLAAMIWAHDRLDRDQRRLWHIDDWHPYMDAFAGQLGDSCGRPVTACPTDDLDAMLAAGNGPAPGDIVFVTRFNLDRVRERIGDPAVQMFAVAPRVAPATLERLMALPRDRRLGVVCVENRFARISGKVIERCGIGLAQRHANTSDIATLSGLFAGVDAITISTLALRRLEAAHMRLPDMPIIPFLYELPDEFLATAASFVAKPAAQSATQAG
jgi:GntR family transcriptional regulator